MERPETVLLRHRGSKFDHEVVGRWLAATTDLAAEIVVEPDRRRRLRTLKHEYRRSGVLGLVDALLFRVYYSATLADSASEKVDELVARSRANYDDYDVPKYAVDDPNSVETQNVLVDVTPDLMVARTKVLLEEDVYSVPRYGTFVIHPGICPEYRNQHGCFWALANGDDENVGYSLLRIDDGIDTGEIFAQNGTTFDPLNDEHTYLQSKVVADNLDEMEEVLRSVANGTATLIDTDGRPAGFWGMPKMSAWVTWKRRVRTFDVDHVDSTR